MKVLMICSAGISSSLIADKMQKILDERKDGSLVIARPQEALRDLVDQYDCVLIGPQLRYLFKELTRICNEAGKPISMMEAVDYGKQDANAILKTAEKCMSK